MAEAHALRDLVVSIARRMYDRGYIAGTNGNLSVLMEDGRVLTTPSGVAKCRMEACDLVVTDTDGVILEGQDSPSSELAAHLACYKARDDVRAVVHAHPRTVIGLYLAGHSLAEPYLTETAQAVGPIAAVGCFAPGSKQLAEAVGRAITDHHVVVMERHGTITTGSDLVNAFLRLECLEHAAEVLQTALTLGSGEPTTLTQAEARCSVAHPVTDAAGTQDAPASTNPGRVLERLHELRKELVDRLSELEVLLGRLGDRADRQ